MTGHTDRPRTVVFVSHTAQRSGAEAVMARMIDRALEQGSDVVLASPTGEVSARLPEGARHLPLPPMGLQGGGRVTGAARLVAAWMRAGVALRRHVRDPEAAVVVNSLMALPALRFAAGTRADVCTWLVHDTVRYRKQHVVIGFSERAVRRAVAVSDVTAEALRGSAFPVTVRPNGVRTVDAPAPLHHGGRPVIGILGTLTEWKGQEVLLRAMAGVPGVDVEIAGTAMPGDEAYEARLRELAESSALRGRVRFLGYADASECLRRWTLLVSASIRPEAGPLGVLEGLAAGCPVIGTRGSGYMSPNGPCAVVPPDDPEALAAEVTRLIADPAERSRMAMAGRALVAAEHDVRRTVPAMYEELIRP